MLPPLRDIEVDRIHGPNDQQKKAARRQVDVDMNPMVDLAFLLLTFFMLATTFSKPQALELLVPAKPKADDVQQEMPVKESKTLSLVLNPNKVVYYRGITDPVTFETDYSDEALNALLLSAKADTEGLVVLVKPLASAKFENIVAVLDALANTAVERYALDAPSEFDQQTEEETPQP